MPTLTSSKQSANIADQVYLTCSFDNPSALAANPSVKWYLNNTEMSSSNFQNDKINANPTGKSVYRIPSAGSGDMGDYKCKVMYNVGGLVRTSSDYSQYVQYIYNESPSTYILASQTATITCSAYGNKGSFKWTYKNGTDVSLTSDSQYSDTVNPHSGFYMSSELQISRLTTSDSPVELKCTVSYESGDTLSSIYDINIYGERNAYFVTP